MLLTILTICQVGTAGMLAGFLTLPWHSSHNPHSSQSLQHEFSSEPFGVAPLPTRLYRSIHPQ